MKQNLLRIAMLIAMLLAFIQANAYDFEVDGIYYNKTSDSTVAVTYRGSDYSNEYSGSVDIPENVTYSGITYSVTAIGEYAFDYCIGLTSVTIPNSVTSIGNSAFYYCSGLTSVTIPNSVTSIGDYTFSYCSGLTSVTIPNSVTAIGSGAFSYCSSLTSLTIPNSVTSIGYEAFSDSHIHSLTLGSGLLSLGTCYDFEAEKVIWLANTPPTGYQYYAGKINYTANDSYNFTNNGTDWYVYDHLSSLFEADGIIYVPVNPAERTCDIIDCSYSESAKNTSLNKKVSFRGIEMSVKNIQPYAFYGNDFIENLTVEMDGEIPTYAFYGCSNINSIELPASITGVGDSAFAGCSSVTNIHLANTGSIGEYAFSNSATKEAATLTVLPSVTDINAHAFSGCEALTDLTLNNTGTIGYYAFINSATKEAATLTVLPTVTDIRDNAFYGCKTLTNVKLNNTGSIGANAFENSCSLYPAQLDIASTVTSIGASAFSNCSQLNSAVINNSGHLGNYSFDNCTELKTAEITNNGDIGKSAFNGCQSLENINIQSIGAVGNYAFQNCSSASSLTIAPTVTSIGDYSFDGCTSIADVTIENMPASPGKPTKTPQTFEDWTSTNHSDGSTSSHEWTFDVEPNDILSFEYWTDSEANYDNLKITVDGESVAELSGTNQSKTYTKKFDTAKSVTVTASYEKDSSQSSGSDTAGVRNIGLNITTSESNINILTLGSNGSNPMFADCPLDEVYIGRKLSYKTSGDYGYSPFYRNTSLRSVEIADVETQIYDNEFYGCTNLQEVRIGDGVKSFGKYAFSGCSKIESFEFGRSVETIGDEAFSDCTAMVSMVSHNPVPPVCGTEALDDINKWECTLHVPADALDAYQAADQWKNFFFINEDATSNGYFEQDGLCFRILEGSHRMCEVVSPDVAPESVRKRVVAKAPATSIEIPETASRIGLKYNVKGIAANAFSSYSALESVTIPATVEYVGNAAFAGCTNLSAVTVKAEVPPTAYSDTFDNVVYTNATLSVPDESRSRYAAAECWKEFANVEAGIGTVLDDELTEIGRYSLDGQPVGDGYRGIVVVRYSDGSTRKVVVR